MNTQHRRGSARARSSAGKQLFALIGVALFAAVIAAAATAKIAAKPSNAQPPTISGTTTEGSTLNVDHGNWDGTQPITFTYRWQRCDKNGDSCAGISNANGAAYVLKSVDVNATLRVRVSAKNSDGTTSIVTVPSAVIARGTPASTTPASGCPALASGQSSVPVTGVTSPARLQIDQFQSSPSVIPGSMTSFTLRVHVNDTCGQAVSGADVYATAVPFHQVNVPSETATGNDGWVTLQFNRESGFPATPKQQLMVIYIRARQPGQSPLAGITTSRLVSFRVNLKG